MEGPSLSELRLDVDDEHNTGERDRATPKSDANEKDRGKEKNGERVWEKRARKSTLPDEC